MKDTKRQKAARKDMEKHINKLKESILNYAKNVVKMIVIQKTKSAKPGATISTISATTRSKDTYSYGVGIIAFLTIGIYVFFA